MSTCKYFQVLVDPQVLENLRVFDSRLRVTRWLKPTRIPSMVFRNWNTCGYRSGSPMSALVLCLNGGLQLYNLDYWPARCRCPHCACEHNISAEDLAIISLTTGIVKTGFPLICLWSRQLLFLNLEVADQLTGVKLKMSTCTIQKRMGLAKGPTDY